MAYTDIDDASEHFQTAVWTGTNATGKQITNGGNSDLKPDLIWAKARTSTSYTDNHFMVDSSRGRTKGLITNTTDTETTTTGNQSQQAERDLESFDTDGFTVGIVNSTAALNAQDASNIAWQWKANGGTTASNSDGNITSTVQANTEAGFSIVTWTGNENSSASVGHGLGVTPDLVMFKNRSSAYNWVVYLGALGQVSGNNMFAYLNLTNAAEQGAGITFTSSLLNPGSGASTNASSMIAYCFNNVQGYSKFGKYVGNGSTDGAFVYTGFKPAWVMIKRSDGVTNWRLFDNKRSGFNADTSQLYPNLNNAEDSAGDQLELLSNGFKNRTVSGDQNGSGSNYIYMAFAENPFVAGGIPTTAR